MVRERTEKEKEKDYELASRTLDAVLLGFETPIKYDKTIPTSPRFHSSIFYALHRLYGNKKKKLAFFQEDQHFPRNGAAGCGHPVHYCEDNIDKINGLEHRLKKGLKSLLTQEYYYGLEPVLSTEWFMGYGDLASFRTGEKEKAEKRVNDFFSQKELEEITSFYPYLNEYVKKEYRLKK